MTATPKVSVWMLTYNHAAFIAEAIDSVLAQQAPFDVQLVVGDDCSTDDTRAILREYQRRFPTRITLVLQSTRVGPRRNGTDTFNACTGEYVAFLEGDDYWTDQHKLRDQVALMDANPNAILCGARAQLWRDGDSAPSDIMPGDASTVLATYGSRELFEAQWWFRTCTQMFRRRIIEQMPPRFGGDWSATMWLIANTNFGDVCFLDRVVGVYREHGAGVWSAMPQHGRLARDIHALYGLIPLFRGADRAQLQQRMRQTFESMLEIPDAPASRVVHCGALTAVRCSEYAFAWAGLIAGARRLWR